MKCKKTLSTLLFLLGTPLVFGFTVNQTKVTVKGPSKSSSMGTGSKEQVSGSGVKYNPLVECNESSHGDTISNNLLKILTLNQGVEIRSAQQSKIFEVQIPDLISRCAKLEVSANKVNNDYVLKFKYEKPKSHKESDYKVSDEVLEIIPDAKVLSAVESEELKTLKTLSELNDEQKERIFELEGTGEEKILRCLINNDFINLVNGELQINPVAAGMKRTDVTIPIPLGDHNTSESAEIKFAAPAKSPFKSTGNINDSISFEDDAWKCLQVEESDQALFAYETGLDRAHREADRACNSNSPTQILQKMQDFNNPDYYGNLGLVKSDAEKIILKLEQGYKKLSFGNLENEAVQMIRALSDANGVEQELISDIDDLISEMTELAPEDTKKMNKLKGKLVKKLNEYDEKILTKLYDLVVDMNNFETEFGETLSEDERQVLAELSSELSEFGDSFLSADTQSLMGVMPLIKSRDQLGRKLYLMKQKSAVVTDLCIECEGSVTPESAEERIKDSRKDWRADNKRFKELESAYKKGDTSSIQRYQSSISSSQKRGYSIQNDFYKSERSLYQKYCLGNLMKLQWSNQARCKSHTDPRNQDMRKRMMMSKYKGATSSIPGSYAQVDLLQQYHSMGERYRLSMMERGKDGRATASTPGSIYGTSFLYGGSGSSPNYSLGGYEMSNQFNQPMGYPYQYPMPQVPMQARPY